MRVLQTLQTEAADTRKFHGQQFNGTTERRKVTIRVSQNDDRTVAAHIRASSQLHISLFRVDVVSANEAWTSAEDGQSHRRTPSGVFARRLLMAGLLARGSSPTVAFPVTQWHG